MRQWLVETRKAAGKSQQKVADEAGISQSYYAGLETGIRGSRINPAIARKLAAVLDFDWTWFYEEPADRSVPVEAADAETGRPPAAGPGA